MFYRLFGYRYLLPCCSCDWVSGSSFSALTGRLANCFGYGIRLPLLKDGAGTLVNRRRVMHGGIVEDQARLRQAASNLSAVLGGLFRQVFCKGRVDGPERLR